MAKKRKKKAKSFIDKAQAQISRAAKSAASVAAKAAAEAVMVAIMQSFERKTGKSRKKRAVRKKRL